VTKRMTFLFRTKTLLGVYLINFPKDVRRTRKLLTMLTQSSKITIDVLYFLCGWLWLSCPVVYFYRKIDTAAWS
jgi:hypothetical protein